MPDDNKYPEQRARDNIDRLLREAGWVVQDMKELNSWAGQGVAVREFPIPGGKIDYVLYVDRKIVGTLEAKKEGEVLTNVEPQTKRYSDGIAAIAEEKGYPYADPIPFHYISTGAETRFVDLRDTKPRPRDLFAFFKPETLSRWLAEGSSLRGRLRTLPELDPTGLRPVQVEAITGLESSMAAARQKALVKMSGGAGKTYVGVATSYRLLKNGGAKRILFLVDRRNLGRQAYDEFFNYLTPDDGRRFGEIYNIQLLRSNTIDEAASVVITTMQRLYRILKGEAETEEDIEEQSMFEMEAQADETPLEVVYRPEVPIELFDAMWIDECHRSIYGKYGQVLDYFDAFKVGLSATPIGATYGYFDGNVVTDYTYQQSVIDDINVDFQVYRIKTEISEHGATIARGETVQVFDKASHKKTYKEMDDALTYDKAKLDRAVVAPDQIRTVIKTFKEKLPEIFPGRQEVPKTVIFCKDDLHAENVLKVVRDVFGADWNFAQKITYKSEGDSDDLIRDLRNTPDFRIAVTVDQISTGTDIRPLECLVFMRYVGSRTHFDQMKFRGVRKCDPTELKAVTGSAETKDHFVLVDCVGVTDEERAWIEAKPLDQKPTVPLKSLLDDLAKGITKPELLSTIAARLSRLDKRLSDEQRDEAEKKIGSSLHDAASALVEASSEEKVELVAKAALQQKGEEREPTEQEIEAAREQLVVAAVSLLMKAEARKTILSLQSSIEQIIDLERQDSVIHAGPVDRHEAEEVVQTFKKFIDEKHDDYVALKVFYSRPYGRRITLGEIKKLAEAIKSPPYLLTPQKVWEAYEKLEASKVKGQGGKLPADLVSLLRFTLGEDEELLPHKEIVRLRFDMWLRDQGGSEKFSAEQLRWLEMVRDHMEESLLIEKDDFELAPFVQEGGLYGAAAVFGDQLDSLLDSLNESLVAV
jgi:type I restriction enzyme R subunit